MDDRTWLRRIFFHHLLSSHQHRYSLFPFQTAKHGSIHMAKNGEHGAYSQMVTDMASELACILSLADFAFFPFPLRLRKVSISWRKWMGIRYTHRRRRSMVSEEHLFFLNQVRFFFLPKSQKKVFPTEVFHESHRCVNRKSRIFCLTIICTCKSLKQQTIPTSTSSIANRRCYILVCLVR